MMVAEVSSALRVNGDRLMSTLRQLAQVGQLPNGGVQRFAFSTEDCAARKQVSQWMQQAGMTVRTDEAGNIIGRYPGNIASAPPLVTGSHIDTVPNAGHYDGTYGVLAGIEVVAVLAEQTLHLRHPLEVIVFADEERTMIGCKAIAGHLLKDAALYQSRDNEPIENCLSRVGGNWARITQARRARGAIAAFVELHVEQGPVLTTAAKQIGVVTGIVGQRRYTLTVTGQSSHAGTTPMTLRRDALVAAAQVVLAINRIGNQSGDQVATVGMMHLHPNVANSIPGKVEMSLDLRDLSRDRLDALIAEIRQSTAAIAATTATQITLEQCLHNEPAPASESIQRAIVQSCQALGLSFCHLPSRASHDAQELAHITDMGMIFVPSEGGISHAETEYTRPEDCINGANVLLHTLLELDTQYPIGNP